MAGAGLLELIADIHNHRDAQQLGKGAKKGVGKGMKKPTMTPSSSMRIRKLVPQRG